MLKEKVAENWQWVGLWLVLIFSAIYSRPLIPIDETRYLSVAWEMWQNNEFLVPHINGQLYSHKPPLFFWFIHLSWLLFGVGEWSGRLVGPLFGFGSIVLTVRLAKLLWPVDRDVRIAAPFVLLGTLVWTFYCSLTMFDTLLTFWTLLALISMLEARKRVSILPWFWLSLSIGLGILAKGPIILLYVLPAMLLAPIWDKGGSFAMGRWYGLVFFSLAAGIGIALCWALPAAIAGGEEYQQEIFFSQTAGRMVKAFAHNRHFFWYALLLPFLCFPWFFWLPVWKGWKKIFAEHSARFCLCVVLPAFFLLSCVSGKQTHYVLPLMPLIALLIARTATSLPRRSRFERMPLLVIYLAFAMALIVVPQLSLQGGDLEMVKNIPQWIAIVPFSCALYVSLCRSSSAVNTVKTLSTSLLILFIFLHISINKPLHAIYDQSAIAEKIKKAQMQGGQVSVFPAHLADQFQFAGRLTKSLIPHKSFSDIVLWGFKNPQQFILLFTKDNHYELLKGDGIVRRYKDGWLIFRPAGGLFADFQNWFTTRFIPPKIESRY